MNIHYKKGKRAKELLNIYKNPYRQNTYEHEQWKKGFDEGIHEPIDYEVEIPDCDDVLIEYEPLNIDK
jgi:hypothetical protein